MRGEAEQHCFGLVKEQLYTENFFAMSYEDDEVIRAAFNEAKPNPSASEFPDFIFKDGFIEHFIVTSSSENRKGATMAREKSQIHREFQEKVNKSIENVPDNGITIQSVQTTTHWHKTHSYENFAKSFRSNFENHVLSLNKYEGPKKHGIFMIEYTDMALKSVKNYPQDLMTDVSYGDLLQRENPAYRLSRDIQLLNYIYERRADIEFVIFVNESGFHGTLVDVIKTQNALEIVKLLHEGYSFHCAMIASSESGIGVIVPDDLGDGIKDE